jgi:histidinol-phosphatase
MYERELAFANELADRAAEIGTKLFRQSGLEIRRKADRSLVTKADTMIERTLRESIGIAFPGDRILGEEEGGSHDPVGRVWILDPIDGTANYARGIPVWATLIALQVDGEGVVGVAGAPLLGERYAAVRGAGATMDGARIEVSDISVIGDAQVLFQEFDELTRERYREASLGLARDAWRTRGFGDFWGHALVARGAAEVVLEPGLAIWDYAALQVIVEEAGGTVSMFDGSPLTHGGSMLATNGALHEEVLRRFSASPAASRQ